MGSRSRTRKMTQGGGRKVVQTAGKGTNGCRPRWFVSVCCDEVNLPMEASVQHTDPPPAVCADKADLEHVKGKLENPTEGQPVLWDVQAVPSKVQNALEGAETVAALGNDVGPSCPEVTAFVEGLQLMRGEAALEDEAEVWVPRVDFLPMSAQDISEKIRRSCLAAVVLPWILHNGPA